MATKPIQLDLIPVGSGGQAGPFKVCRDKRYSIPPTIKPGTLHNSRVRTHWFRVIADLIHCGYPMPRIAKETKLTLSKIKGYHLGAEPRFEDGVDLLHFWCKVTGQTMSEVPRIRRYAWMA